MANFISISRIFIVFIAIILLFIDNSNAYWWAFGLTICAFAMDGLDGYVARKFNETSKLGAVLDIMGDRIAENAYWITFAVLGWLPVIFPLVALTRSIVTDSLRSVALEQGYTAFGPTSMQQNKISQFICCSKFMRISYAVAKVLAFIIIIAAYIPNLSIPCAEMLYNIGYVLAVLAIVLCVLRGLPVVFESGRLFENAKNEGN